MSNHRPPLRILGLTGGPDPVFPVADPDADSRYVAMPQMGPPIAFHDAAAALLCDGVVTAAIEEERLNRLKHTNCFPTGSIRYCASAAGIDLRDVDCFAFYGSEKVMNTAFALETLRNQKLPPLFTARQVLQHAFARHLDVPVDPDRFAFIEHHLAHAYSAFYQAPFDDALVVTLDGIGETLSGTVWEGHGTRLERLADIDQRDSLGELYQVITLVLGYTWFDEYKVMGLAPYGDPARLSGWFDKICELGADGTFTVHLDRITAMAGQAAPRRAGQPFLQIHKDLAAALQASIERVSRHLLEHYRDRTGLRDLCLAGGVAHNSSMTGALLRSGLFDRVFVHPASHDAGCAVGAAIAAHLQRAPDVRVEPIAHVYWGTDAGRPDDIAARLEQWGALLHVTRAGDVAADTAALLADDAVVGWVQGRSEFGPRALGNRSILADPRPAHNKDRINRMVKKREAYRPFAPSVMEEHADEWFDIPRGNAPSFMTYTVPVREAMRSVLGAVTHVDGTARVQTVSRSTNPRFWALLDAFRQRTGVPLLLNTSFNNNAEPIVDSIDDAVACFLTTGLTHLVIGDHLVTKRALSPATVGELVPTIPDHLRVVRARQNNRAGEVIDVFRCETPDNRRTERLISRRTYEVLSRADGRQTLAEIANRLGWVLDEALCDELHELWSLRAIRFLPAMMAEAPAGRRMLTREARS